jgi:integrase
MRAETLQNSIVQRGRRAYVEIESSNVRYEAVKKRLSERLYRGVTPKTQETLLQFLKDLEKGLYVSSRSKKGPRGVKRLLKLFYVVKRIAAYFVRRNILELTEKDIHQFFDELNSDKIKRDDGTPYKDKRDFKKDFSTFWEWHRQRSFKLKGQKVESITDYLSTPLESKPKFVYFTLDDLKSKIMSATNNEDLKAVLLVMFDLGARPSEFYNLRLNDFEMSKDRKKYLVNIPEEISKTYGRKIHLWLSTTALKNYVQRNKFSGDDLIFINKKSHVKKFLWEINKRSDVKKLTATVAKSITFYDFRHSSACYYLNRYGTKEMKYRFGWKQESEIEYYTSYLGKQDFLTEDQLLSPEDKTQIEKELADVKVQLNERDHVIELMNHRMKIVEQQQAILKRLEEALFEKESALRRYSDGDKRVKK